MWSFAKRVRLALLASHSAYKQIADHEAQALFALGFTGSAVERYRELVRDLERLAAAEPDRMPIVAWPLGRTVGGDARDGGSPP